MCGIAGFCRLADSSLPLDGELLNAMAKRLAHRGPDDQGTFVNHEAGVGLANRRLSIIDLSAAGHMPLSIAGDSFVISYNGEIYNYRELRSELESLGVKFKSDTDTEVILHGYAQWSEAVLDKLDGIFAFAIFDKTKNELFLARDRIGVKPLYFSQQGGFFSFASEIKALWELPWMRHDISPQGMYHYLTFMVTPAPYTIFKGVYKLPAGYCVKITTNRDVIFRAWYDILKRVTSQPFIEKENFYSCVDGVLERFTQATKKRLVADVPVGAFLSGGLDSSLNVALMAKFLPRVRTFTINFSDGPEHDELAWARLVAQRFDTEHHEVTITEKDAASFFEAMVYHLDEPLADCVCVPFYYVSQLARNCGMKVVQVGEGADELFFGYPVYAQHARLNELWQRMALRGVPSFLRRSIGIAAEKFFKARPRYADLINNWLNGRGHFWSGSLAFSEKQKQELLAESVSSNFYSDEVIEKIYPGLRQEFDSYAIIDYHRHRLFEAIPNADFGQEIFYLELKHRLPELLLMRADKMSMAASIEAREPYLDYQLVEFAFQIPLRFKYQNQTTKYLLKKVARGILPDVIIDRKKQGFGAPTVRWYGQGKIFPEYYHKLMTGDKPVKQFFRAPERKLEESFKAAQSQYAVQKWVLQSLWATRI